MKLITNGVDGAASDLQLTAMDAVDLAVTLATGKSSETSTEVAEKPCAVPLMNGQNKITLKETEKLLTTNGFSKNIQVKSVKEVTETSPIEAVPEKSPKIFDDENFPTDREDVELPSPTHHEDVELSSPTHHEDVELSSITHYEDVEVPSPARDQDSLPADHEDVELPSSVEHEDTELPLIQGMLDTV